MPKYTFIKNGENFKIYLEGKIRRTGYCTTRKIEEKDIEAAELLTLDSIRAEWNELVLNNRSDPPMLLVDNIYEVEGFESELVPGKGPTWYDEKDECK